MSNSVNLSLDVTKTGIQNPLIKVRQGDGGFETLRTTVTANGEPMDLQGWTITFMGTTAGNHKIVDANVMLVEAPNGIFDYTPSKAWGMDIGDFKIAYFKFVKGDGSASSANFRVNVIESVDLTQEEAQNYISVVDATIAEARERLENSLADVTASVAATSSAVSSLSVSVSSTASSAVSQANSAASNASSVASNAVSQVNSASDIYVKKSGDTMTGGLKGGQVNLPASGDLNTLTDTGKYYQTTSVNAVNWSNRPSNAPNLAFSVDVIGQANRSLATQVFYVHTTSRMWVRTIWLDGTIQGSAWAELANDAQLVHKTGTETIAGDKTFTSPVNGNLSGNAATATKWQTARTLALTGDVTGSVSMDGSNNVSIATSGANLVHKSGSETIGGDKTFAGTTNMNKLNVSGATTFYTKSINWSTGIMQGNWTLQRIGSWVMAKFDMSATTSTGNTTLTLPIGFRPLSDFVRDLEAGNAGMKSDGSVFISTSYSGSNAMTFIFPTNDAWPV